MRRMDRERSDGYGGRGFRVLDPGGCGRYLEPLTPPPPPRAPEPYKVAPASSCLGRAHRRSSFVIIAEARPATPSSRSSSPAFLASGRVSPFRGRGFKGPLPHAQSRPQTPENRHRSGRRHGRFDKLASVSQQCSPKRSLIPQPTRRRSVSLTKNNDATVRSSPKFGRRAAVTRKNVNPGNTRANPMLNNSRRPSFKAPDLSPIQGTPTKPVDASARFISGSSISNKLSNVKTQNSLTVTKYVENSRKSNRERSPAKSSSTVKRFVEEKKINVTTGSTTKIPMRRGSIINKNGSTRSLSTSIINGKSVESVKSVKSGGKSSKIKNDSKPNSNLKIDGNADSRVSGSRDDRRDDKNKNDGPTTNSRFIDVNSVSRAKKGDEDLGLLDLLKQSSGATGTSSVVSTTTTTAVQPLHIEAAAIFQENDRTKITETKNKKKSTPLLSPADTDVSPISGLSTIVASESSTIPKSSKLTNGHRDSGGTEKNVNNRGNDVKTVTMNPTSNSTSLKNCGKVNAVDDPTQTPNNLGNKKETNIASVTKEKNMKPHGNLVAATDISKKSLLTRNGLQDGSRSEMGVPSASSGSRADNNNDNNNDNINRNKNGDSEENESAKQGKSGKEIVEISGNSSIEKVSEGASSLSLGHQKSDSKSSTKSLTKNGAGNGDVAKRTLSRTVGVPNTGIIENSVNSVVRATEIGENGKFRVNHGSETSLKSTNRLSTGSIDSIRSTDTGVSVNTVRGVSSAREKKGMHTMKKSEEIETLSGNIMHLERNGEPAWTHPYILRLGSVLDGIEPTGDPLQFEPTRLDRLKNSVARFHERLSSMRCLGCRRNRKAQSLSEGERRSQSIQQLNLTANRSNANTEITRFRRAWTNFKNACRCMRLRECKCCRRAARVAPAESSTACCPPERGCGAMCRRLFAHCTCCTRSEGQHTRSIRAKHSLTSVAPPPLSEEQRPKIPEVLVEHNSIMRGAIPCLPVPLAWFCLVWNILIPGSGTVWSGLFNLCSGQPRFAVTASPRARFGSMVVNAFVGVGQLFTVLFCLVGWGWSIWWGVTMIRLARKYKRFRASEAANGDAEARGGDSTGLPAGVPSQAIRGIERAR